MSKNKLIIPFLKWVGGKRQLMPSIKENLPNDINKLKYFEPFIGGGAVFFDLQPKKGVINDFNSELINVYQTIKDNPEELIENLKLHVNDSEYYYNIRSLDRSEDYNELTNIEKASRIIYLNKTCYNGLYRVNNSGEFNSPFGRYKNPNIVNETVLKAVSNYLNKANIEIRNDDYADILLNIKKNSKSFVYLDPPYHPISETSNFTGYVQGGWDIFDQIRLKEACDVLNANNIKFLLSNSASQQIIDLYNDYKIEIVKANRYINSNPNNRGEVDEVLIKNYE